MLMLNLLQVLTKSKEQLVHLAPELVPGHYLYDQCVI